MSLEENPATELGAAAMAVRSNDSDDILEAKYAELKCRLDPSDVHFFFEPKRLPCNQTACLECIRKQLNPDSNILKCSLCSSDHKIDRLDDLVDNHEASNEINLNWNDISLLLVKKLDNQVENLSRVFNNKDDCLKNQCEKAKQDVSKRVEELKSHLDVLHQELLVSLSQIKVSLTSEVDELNALVEERCQNYDELIQNMESIVNELEDKKETAEKLMYECQDGIDDLGDLEQRYHRTMRKVTFEPSDWLPDEKFIAAYIGKFNINDEDSQATESDDEDEE